MVRVNEHNEFTEIERISQITSHSVYLDGFIPYIILIMLLACKHSCYMMVRIGMKKKFYSIMRVFIGFMSIQTLKCTSIYIQRVGVTLHLYPNNGFHHNIQNVLYFHVKSNRYPLSVRFCMCSFYS